MKTLTINNRQIPLDKDGNLEKLEDWDKAVAEALAAEESIVLTAEHWEIINLLRDFYRQYELSPAMRVLVKHVGLVLGKEKGKSIYLMQLFPPSPARVAAKIAGLPRPANCL